MRRVSLFAALLMLAIAAPARMYQWVDPDTQTSQLSGTPPTWYRSVEGGPRVFVVENGQVIDDTGVQVTEPDRARLREEAFIQAERDREAAKQKLLEAKRLKAAFDGRKQEEEEAQPEVEAAAPELPAADTDAGEGEGGPTPEEMRALIEQWEKLRALDAKQLLGGETAEQTVPAAGK